MNRIRKFKEFVKKNNQYIYNHTRLVKKCGFKSSILDIKVIPITSLYKLFRELLIRDNTQMSNDNLTLLVIYLLTVKLKLDLKRTELLHDELEISIPDFEILRKRFSMVLNNLLIIANIVHKDTDVINNFDKFLNTIDIYKIINSVGLFSKEHNIGLKELSFIHEKNNKVLKNIVDFIKSTS